MGEMENKWEEEEEQTDRGGDEDPEHVAELVKGQQYRKRATFDRQTGHMIVNVDRPEVSCVAAC